MVNVYLYFPRCTVLGEKTQGLESLTLMQAKWMPSAEKKVVVILFSDCYLRFVFDYVKLPLIDL